jgi:hypothetical protein
MYFTLINDIKFESDIYIKEPEDYPSELHVIGGNFIDIPVENPIVFTTNAKAGDVIRDFDNSSFLIMSKRFLELLQQAGVDNLQTFPVIIKSEEDGTVWEDYFSVNILGLISCADLSKSTYTEIMPGYYRFRELAIHAEKAKDALMFRLQEHSPTIIMHRSVGRYIKEHDPDKTLLGWTVGRIIQ